MNYSRVIQVVVVITVLGLLRLGFARDGSTGARSRSYVTIAGTIDGITERPRLRFSFASPSTSRRCPPVEATTLQWAGPPRFSAQVNVEGCVEDLFDGADVNVSTEVLSGDGAVLVSTPPANINPAPYALHANRSYRADSVGAVDNTRGWLSLGGNRIVFNYSAGGRSGQAVPRCDFSSGPEVIRVPVDAPPSGVGNRIWTGTGTVVRRGSGSAISVYDHFIVYGMTSPGVGLRTQCLFGLDGGCRDAGSVSNISISRSGAAVDDGFLVIFRCSGELSAIAIHLDLYSRLLE